MHYDPLEEYTILRVRQVPAARKYHVGGWCRNGKSGNVIIEDIFLFLYQNHIGLIIFINIHILNMNTFGAFQFGTPFSIKVQLIVNPETVTTVVADSITIVRRYHIAIGTNRIRHDITPLVHRVGLIYRFVVGGSGHLIGNGNNIGIEHLGAGLIGVPAHNGIVITQTGRNRNLSAVANTESHGLVFSTPIQRRIILPGLRINSIRMQENTVLDLTPLGIDSDTFRHISESIGLGTSIIHIPALKNEAGEGGFIIVGTAFVIGRNRGLERNILHLTQLATTFITVHRVVTTIHINTIIIRYIIGKGSIADIEIGVVGDLAIISIVILLT